MVHFIFGLIVGVSALAALLMSIPSSYCYMASNAMKECEKSLPRDQTCIVVAVPKVKEMK